MSRQKLYTHRLSYEHHHGPIPAGHEVCHRCDTPACLNPDHLFAGTHAQNMADMQAKGRGNNAGHRGETHGMAKLTAPQVLEIRRRLNAGERQPDLAAEFNVRNTTISMIHRRHTWRHL